MWLPDKTPWAIFNEHHCNYKNHPSILKINESVKLTETFTFSKVNETQIKTEISELNPKKSAGFDALLQKLSKIQLQ